jgi:hypothetical protein
VTPRSRAFEHVYQTCAAHPADQCAVSVGDQCAPPGQIEPHVAFTRPLKRLLIEPENGVGARTDAIDVSR